MYKKEINQETIKDFSARKATMLLALQAMRDAEYPKQRHEGPCHRRAWEEHHQACMAKLAEQVYGVEFG